MRMRATVLLATMTLVIGAIALVVGCGSRSGEGPEPTPERPSGRGAEGDPRTSESAPAPAPFAPPAPVASVRKDLPTPTLPGEMHKYADADNDYPDHFTNRRSRAGIAIADNTPAENPITNAGATLGRVLFYDKRLSANDTVACGNCHKQSFGFADANRYSIGWEGKRTTRHAMGLSNARYYRNGRFFWDERAETLEAQVLMPIQDPIEMGMKLDDLEVKLGKVAYYAPLFEAAFGTPVVTRDRIAKALAQFVRSMVSYRSKYDEAFAKGKNGVPDFKAVFTEEEQMGHELFTVVRGAQHTSLCCGNCHQTAVQAGDAPRNNGLDLDTTADQGAGSGRFKVPSLRNIARRGSFMHDGRFASLYEVVSFYSDDIQGHPNLDVRLRAGGEPRRMNLSEKEKRAVVAFLYTLTDEHFLSDPKFADPFPDEWE